MTFEEFYSTQIKPVMPRLKLERYISFFIILMVLSILLAFYLITLYFYSQLDSKRDPSVFAWLSVVFMLLAYAALLYYYRRKEVLAMRYYKKYGKYITDSLLHQFFSDFEYNKTGIVKVREYKQAHLFTNRSLKTDYYNAENIVEAKKDDTDIQFYNVELFSDYDDPYGLEPGKIDDIGKSTKYQSYRYVFFMADFKKKLPLEMIYHNTSVDNAFHKELSDKGLNKIDDFCYIQNDNYNKFPVFKHFREMLGSYLDTNNLEMGFSLFDTKFYFVICDKEMMKTSFWISPDSKKTFRQIKSDYVFLYTFNQMVEEIKDNCFPDSPNWDQYFK